MPRARGPKRSRATPVHNPALCPCHPAPEKPVWPERTPSPWLFSLDQRAVTLVAPGLSTFCALQCLVHIPSQSSSTSPRPYSQRAAFLFHPKNENVPERPPVCSPPHLPVPQLFPPVSPSLLSSGGRCLCLRLWPPALLLKDSPTDPSPLLLQPVSLLGVLTIAQPWWNISSHL